MRIEDLGARDMIHCSTKEESLALRILLDSKGYKWESGTSYLEASYWDTYFDQTCYDPVTGTYASVKFCLEASYRVIPFSDIAESPYRIGLAELYPISDEDHD